eukprot:12912867-Prorocentrum_lima.AAC.1
MSDNAPIDCSNILPFSTHCKTPPDTLPKRTPTPPPPSHATATSHRVPQITATPACQKHGVVGVGSRGS